MRETWASAAAAICRARRNYVIEVAQEMINSGRRNADMSEQVTPEQQRAMLLQILGEHGTWWSFAAKKEIERLAEAAHRYQRERAELYDKLNGTPCAETRWQQEREELQAALRPFAKFAEEHVGSWLHKPDSALFYGMKYPAAPIVIGDFRRASKIITALSPSCGNDLEVKP